LAYPTPTPELQTPPSPVPNEDTIMEDGEDAYDYDLAMDTAPMDEDYFDGTDGTMVNALDNVPGPHAPDELQDDAPPIDGLDDDDYIDDQDDHNDPHSPDPDSLKGPWSAATVQTEDMSRLGICIDTTARVVVCIACATVITPLQLPSHFSTTHPPMKIDPTFSQGLLETYNLHPDPTRSRPGRILTAIYGLDIVDGYLSCESCGYACLSENRMKTHIRSYPGCNLYRPRPIQTFLPRSNLMYFGVHLPRASDAIQDHLDPVNYLTAKFAPLPFNQVPIEAPAPRDTHHFLRNENWHRHLEGRTPSAIYEVVRVREPELRKEVRSVLERYAKDGLKKLEKLDNEAKGAIADYLG
jgi:hypothetical protein